MKTETKKIQDKRKKEVETVSSMIEIYCHGSHGTKRGELCGQCEKLKEYTTARTMHCPFMETKTFCSNCRVHCYKPQMREEIRNVMRFAGPRMLFYHPIMAIRHVITSAKEKKRMGRKETYD